MPCLDFSELSPLQKLQFFILTTQWVLLVEQELLTLASRAHEFNLFVGGARVAQSLVLWVVRCEPFFLSFLAIAVSVLRYTGCDYPFGIINLSCNDDGWIFKMFKIRIRSSHSRCQLTSSQISGILWHVNVKSFVHSTLNGSTVYSCTLKCMRHNKEFDLT